MGLPLGIPWVFGGLTGSARLGCHGTAGGASPRPCHSLLSLASGLPNQARHLWSPDKPGSQHGTWIQGYSVEHVTWAPKTMLFKSLQSKLFIFFRSSTVGRTWLHGFFSSSVIQNLTPPIPVPVHNKSQVLLPFLLHVQNSDMTHAAPPRAPSRSHARRASVPQTVSRSGIVSCAACGNCGVPAKCCARPTLTRHRGQVGTGWTDWGWTERRGAYIVIYVWAWDSWWLRGLRGFRGSIGILE